MIILKNFLIKKYFFSLKKILEAKNIGQKITCGVTPHHLFLTEGDEKKLKAYGKMKPSLKSTKDVAFLWKNIKAIDVIESDHAPHSKKEKEGEKTVFGVPGLETTLPLLLSAVNQNKLAVEDVLRLCFENPRKIFKVRTDKDTKIEIDLGKGYNIDNNNLQAKCGWSPFHGWKVKGKVRKVYLRGKKVFEDGHILVKAPSGKVLAASD